MGTTGTQYPPDDEDEPKHLNTYLWTSKSFVVSEILSFTTVVVNRLRYKMGLWSYTYSKWYYLIYSPCQLTVFSSDVCVYDLYDMINGR